MGRSELLKYNLAIEADLQNFIGFVLDTAKHLDGNTFIAASATLEAVQTLRAAGAGSGYPLPVRLVLDDNHLAVESDGLPSKPILELDETPDPGHIEAIRDNLSRSTAADDPEILLRRTAEMERYLEQTRERTERELAAMQKSLEKRQAELSASIHEAETDALTGLANRRAYDERLEAAFRRAQRQNEPLSLVLMDLDFFKEINDTHGHQYGDEYLKRMARAMSLNIRAEVDLAFRFGGDEFALLIFAESEIACEKSLRILCRMDNKISIGIASISTLSGHDASPQDFMHRADDALYAAKRNGRGRVVTSILNSEGTVEFATFLAEDCAAPGESENTRAGQSAADAA